MFGVETRVVGADTSWVTEVNNGAGQQLAQDRGEESGSRAPRDRGILLAHQLGHEAEAEAASRAAVAAGDPGAENDLGVYRRHLSGEIMCYAVWLYHRLTLNDLYMRVLLTEHGEHVTQGLKFAFGARIWPTRRASSRTRR